MSGLYIENAILLAKLHVDNTDPIPTGVANGMAASSINITPLKANENEDDTVRGFSGGGRLKQLYGKTVDIDFKIDMAGSGAAGTAPAYSPLLESCGLGKTVNAEVSVIYKPIAFDLSKKVAIYLNIDGVLHALLNARGTVDWDISMDAKPKWAFKFTGQFAPVVDAAMPTVDTSAFKRAIVCNPANTPTFTIHGYAAAMQTFSGGLGNTYEPTRLVGYDEIDITKRVTTNKTTFRAVKVADKDFFGIVNAETLGAIALVHGITAGNIVKFDHANTQLLNPSYSEMGSKKMLGVDGNVIATAVNNDTVITIQ